MKNHLRKLEHNDNLITAYHVAETSEQTISSNFLLKFLPFLQTLLMDSFLNGLVDDKNGNISGFKVAVLNSQFVKCFGSLQMGFCISSKNCKSLKSDTSWILRVIYWTRYIVNYFKPIKYPLIE